MAEYLSQSHCTAS